MNGHTPLRSISLFVAIFLFSALALQGGQVEPGMTRIRVLQELGEPASAMSRGSIEMLSYRNGAKVTLVDGLVTEAVGQPPLSAEEKASTTEIASPPVISAEEQAIIAAEEAAFSKPDAEQRSKFEQAIADLENRHNSPPAQRAPAKFDLIGFIAGLLIKTVITLLAVKFTAKYWGYEILWGGIVIVALVDTAVRTSISMGAKLLLSLPTVFYADEAISAIVMVMLIKKVSTSQSLNQAIQITITTKTFTIVAGSFLVTMLLQMIS